MTTDELITQLRKKAQMFNAEPLWLLLKEAADRLEEYKNREEKEKRNDDYE